MRYQEDDLSGELLCSFVFRLQAAQKYSMTQSLSKSNNTQEDPIEILKDEITMIEGELEAVKRELGSFEAEIQSRLRVQILQINELLAVYKEQKAAKKLKRLEQKKRGKNYKEPRQQDAVYLRSKAGPGAFTGGNKTLKKLFKEAVVLVHPDKFYQGGENEIKKATSITAQLNGIYRRGDLEELINLYQFIISGTDDAPEKHFSTVSVGPKLRLIALKKKKAKLGEELQRIRNSYIYEIFNTYNKPDLFINELRTQFEERIKQLEKRTRKRGGD